jgi:hypothetical protein
LFNLPTSQIRRQIGVFPEEFNSFVKQIVNSGRNESFLAAMMTWASPFFFFPRVSRESVAIPSGVCEGLMDFC